jgi:putative FmdB family regulatory protein
MPTYDYRCPEGHDFEHFFRKISDAQAELPCPTCGSMATRRVSGGAGLLFKGSGFYLTDYGRNAHRSGDASKSESKSEGSSSTSKDTGSKSESSSGGGEKKGSSSSDSSSSSGGSSSGSSGGTT